MDGERRRCGEVHAGGFRRRHHRGERAMRHAVGEGEEDAGVDAASGRGTKTRENETVGEQAVES
jgi:hypothetical protein